jgi:hypothetical protein
VGTTVEISLFAGKYGGTARKSGIDPTVFFTHDLLDIAYKGELSN